MLDLNDLRLFAHVVESHGLMRAAAELNLPKSTVSRRISGLEKQLGVRLFERGPRKSSITEVGTHLYRHCLEMMASAQAAEDYIQQAASEPAGAARLWTSTCLAQTVLPGMLVEFMRRYPKIRLSMTRTNSSTEWSGESFDVLLRAHVGPLRDSSLIQRRLGPLRLSLVATPEYLARAGALTQIADLNDRDILFFGLQGDAPLWVLADASGAQQRFSFEPRMQAADWSTLHSMAIRHLGIAQLPDWLCRDDLEEGKLVQVLPQWRPLPGSLTMLMPQRQGRTPAVRALADFLAERLRHEVGEPPSLPPALSLAALSGVLADADGGYINAVRSRQVVPAQ